jgi:hypothetical protein
MLCNNIERKIEDRKKKKKEREKGQQKKVDDVGWLGGDV